jgi:hypothetical protein
MRVLTLHPPINRAQATLHDPAQAQRVAIAVRTGRSIKDVRPVRARRELEKQAAERGEEVRLWQ